MGRTTGKGRLARLVDEKFKGNPVAMANEMVIMFCEKYDVPGSGAGYSLYDGVQSAVDAALEGERRSIQGQ